MSSSVEQIKERLNIVDVLGSYIKLEKSGNNFKAKCPFHNEKTPSFFVSPDRDNYYCFGCQAKGDIFSFVEAMEGLDFKGALKLLADRAGVTLEFNRTEGTDEKVKIFSILEDATKYFENSLSKFPEAKEYLKKRGLLEKTISDWRIGYVEDEWRTVSQHLKNKGYTDVDIERAGITKKSEDGSSVYDRFRGRIMFPIFDSAGRVVAFTGRILHDDGKSAKYLNSPETELFVKSKILYGFHKAKQAIRKFDYSVLVEGQMDLIMCHQAGFTNTVASSGTALTTEHLNLLKRISNRVIMAFDADKAGQKAVERGWIMAMSLGMDVKVASIKPGESGEKKDPADLILSDKDAWKNVLKSSVNIIDFLLENILRENLPIRDLGIAVKDKILPYISVVESNIEKSLYITKISDKTGIKEDAVWEDLKKVKVENAVTDEIKNNNLKTDTVERRLIGMCLWLEDKKEKELEISQIKRQYLDVTGKSFEDNLKGLSEITKSELVFEAESYYAGLNEDEFKNEVNDLLRELSLERYKREQEELMIRLKEAERQKDEDKKLSLAKRFNDISKKLNDIKINKFN